MPMESPVQAYQLRSKNCLRQRRITADRRSLLLDTIETPSTDEQKGHPVPDTPAVPEDSAVPAKGATRTAGTSDTASTDSASTGAAGSDLVLTRAVCDRDPGYTGSSQATG